MLKAIIATALVITAAPAIAEIITYDCTIKGGEERGWIHDRLLTSVDTGSKSAMVLDGLVNHYNGAPDNAGFKVLNSGKFRVRWSVLVTDAKPSTIKANYEAQIDPKSNKVAISVRFPLVNVSNRPRGKGNCQILKGKTLF